MRHKQIKLIYFSLGGSEAKEINLGWKKIISTFFCGFLLFLLIVGLILGLTTNLYHDLRVTALAKANTLLTYQLSDMTQKVNKIQSKIKQIEKQDDDLRVFVDLPAIDKDTRDVGVGGAKTSLEYELQILPPETQNQTEQLQGLLDKLERRIDLAFESRSAIEQKYVENQNLLKHTPSIQPIEAGRITARFGNRLDPFIERIRYHTGIDISAPIGTDVYASAAGEVEKAERFPHWGYGKEVVINHGYGIRTRYGHLSKVFVKEGQKVNRWDKIGLVGETGRATGPHLHYEVIVDDSVRDPFQYILNHF